MSPAIINNYFISILLTLLLYLTTFPTFTAAAINCTSTDIICVPASNYNISSIKFNPISTKECQTCVGFTCMPNEEIVITGIGCSDDFERYCPNAPFNVETVKIKTIGYNVLFHHGYRALTCNVYDKCIDVLFNFAKPSGNTNTSGNGLIKRGIDSCMPVTTTAAAVLNNGSMNKINGSKLFVMIVLGLILVKFW